MKLYLICFLISPLVADMTYPDFNSRLQKCEKPTLENGKVRIVKKGRNAKFKCNQTYQLLGEMYATCLRGQWDKIPICVKSGCAPLPPFINGQQLDTYRGAVITFICNPGYTMIGAAQIFCDGSIWNGSMPLCAAPDTAVQTQCDFDLPYICGWTQDPFHTFNWSRLNYQTPSRNIGTGPLFDHTYGKDKGGYYMFIETSSPRILNDTARLFSPVFSPGLTSNQPSCFIFWYHMYGATTGILNIYVKPEGVLFDGSLFPKFTKSGNQGDEWYQGFVSLPSMNQPFQVIVEALRGASYVSDIAIDDVKIINGSECEELERQSTSVEPAIQTTPIVSTATKTQKSTNMTATYPPAPPLPPLPPYPTLEANTEDTTLKNFISKLPTPKTTPGVNSNPQSSDKGISASTTLGPKYIIPTEPTPIILIPFTVKSAAPPRTRMVSSNLTSTTVFSTARTTIQTTRPTIPSTTMMKTIPTTTTNTSTTKIVPSTTKIVPTTTKLAPKTTATTVKRTTSTPSTTAVVTTIIIRKPFQYPKQTTGITRPTRRPITTARTTTTTTRKPPPTTPPPTRKTIVYTVPKLTRSPTTLSTATTEKTSINIFQQDKSYETNEVIEPNEKPIRGKKWIEDRRGPVQRQKEGLSLSSIVGILITVTLIFTVVGIATYFYVRRRQRLRRQSSIAEDSDVRFLTSDEVLDFSLARPTDDDL